MPRKPIDLELRGLQTPRERVWAAMRSFKGKPFTKTEVQDHCSPMVRWTVVDDYTQGLEAAGFIRRVGGQRSAPGQVGKPIAWVIVPERDQAEAPRVTAKGKPVTAGLANEAMWRVMKVMPSFDHHAVAAAASVGGLVVKPATAKGYVTALTRAGYLVVLKPSKPGTAALLRVGRNTGPHAPAITRRKCVFDRNTGQFMELETPQEVCDALPH